MSKFTISLIAAVFVAVLPMAAGAFCACVVMAPAAEPQFTDQEVTLRVGQTRRLPGGLAINFAATNGDSRCPTGAECIWAGNAAITIRTRQGTAAAVTMVLNTTSEPQAVDVGAYNLKLVSLSPYPAVGQTIEKSRYTVVLAVSRVSKEPAPASAGLHQLCAGEKWYRDQPGALQTFSGVLEAVPPTGPGILMRNVYYRLGSRTIFTGGRKLAALDALVGKVVSVTGKAVDFELEGRMLSEIWPAAVRESDSTSQPGIAQ